MTSEQATIISSALSAIIALTVVFINKQYEKGKQKKEKYDAFKKYANPIISASEQLAWRLKEILEFQGAYLLPNAPPNVFFKYKFDSTVYRLCSLLGWIQAARKEQSYFEGFKIHHHKEIQLAIIDFQKKLADGSHIEVSILDDLVKLYNLKPVNLSENDRALLGVELEKIIFKYIPNSIKRDASLLKIDKQINMVKEILDHICYKTKQSTIEEKVIREKIATAINEISREFCWIYRDWQTAIGDVMIEEINGANRRFDIIGFAEFQNIHSTNNWLKKVDGLFASLDVSVNDRFDSRVQQLKQVYSSIIHLIEVLKKLISKQETIPMDSFMKLKAFNSKINNQSEVEYTKTF
ncbi:hypothetical protein [Marinifilum sp. D737]|uniref:hypothetical protein n=1 Tax=Marinifilum sp. D737 TaxID=2969628 RepID=UPI002273C72A|nr:hypothetical protein [Marinifilum sp. D737]MCY1634402.1 hypothetical protein [Marinifilum sp. D737]